MGMRRRLLPLFFLLCFLIGGGTTAPQILAWIHIPQPQKLKRVLPASVFGKDNKASSLSVWVDSSLKQRMEHSSRTVEKSASFMRLRQALKPTSLAFGGLDFMPVYSYFARDRNASRNAAIAVRLGIDELDRVDVGVDEKKEGLKISSELRYRGKKEGLLASLGAPISLKLPKVLPKKVVGYSVFSIRPAELYWTIKRCANYLWGLPASLVHLQIRGLESQMDKLIDLDILGEASQPWEIIEMKSSGGKVVGLLRASILDPVGFEQWLKLFGPALPLINPNLRLEDISVGKVRAYKVVGASFRLVMALDKEAVVVGPSLESLQEFFQMRSKGRGISTKMGIGRGIRSSGGGWISQMNPILDRDFSRGLDEMLQLLRGVKWDMAQKPGLIRITGEAKWAQLK